MTKLKPGQMWKWTAKNDGRWSIVLILNDYKGIRIASNYREILKDKSHLREWSYFKDSEYWSLINEKD